MMSGVDQKPLARKDEDAYIFLKKLIYLQSKKWIETNGLEVMLSLLKKINKIHVLNNTMNH